MPASFLLIFKFGYDIVRRLIHELYFRALGSALVMMLVIGTLFFWLAEGRTFLQALAYSAATMAMNFPYGIGWGLQTTGGILFNSVYLFLSVGLFLLFVLEAGRTMVLILRGVLQKDGRAQGPEACQEAGPRGNPPMSEDLPVAWLARHGETVWSLTG